MRPAEFFYRPRTNGEVFAVYATQCAASLEHDGRCEHTHLEARQRWPHFNEFPNYPALHRLFEDRSRQLSGECAGRRRRIIFGAAVASDVHGRWMFRELCAHVVPGRRAKLMQLYARAWRVPADLCLRRDGGCRMLNWLLQVPRLLSRGGRNMRSDRVRDPLDCDPAWGGPRKGGRRGPTLCTRSIP